MFKGARCVLTESQRKVYEYLKSRTEGGLPPTVREICKATGLRSTSSVHAHLKTLERLGYITRDARLNRAIHLAGEQSTIQVPIVGRVAAGQPILAIEEIEGYVPYAPSNNRSSSEYFALNVRGDSMINAGILDGDIVIAVKTATANNGEIVVAMIQDEATVKRFYREKDGIRLQAENPAYQPIYAKEVSILGKVTAVVRHYK
ncbi:transcriptional repressor LexA [Caproiciproducens galactitolivorans]|nr:transcriptional repressor LexA [Caproiciproducens galactitolivorans]